MARRDFSLGPRQFAAIFPFHFAFDRELKVLQTGEVLPRIYPAATVGTNLREIFRIKRPEAELDFESVRSLSQSVFLLESAHSPLSLKGQMLYVEERDAVFFLCSPWVSDLATLGSLGISLSDFAIHDSIADFLMLLQTKNVGLRELKELAGELTGQRTELREANEGLETLNLVLEERTAELHRANEELQRRYRQLMDARAQAATDSLTGLANHRAFQEAIKGAVQRARDTGGSVGLLMLDVDGFKQANDSYGHRAGDGILMDLADILRSVVRETDVFRYGGDEFTVLLPEANVRDTVRIADRLRREVVKRSMGRATGITVSVGAASFPDTASSIDELVYGADASMYWAKSSGKNRVSEWSELIKHRSDASGPWYIGDPGVRAPDAVNALMASLAAKDPTTASHATRCSSYVAKLAAELDLDARQTSIIRLASLLHDIGKLAVPDRLLFKPGPLDEEEWAEMKGHTTAAVDILSSVPSISDIIPTVLHHHEQFDGSGYPDGLAGEDIPLGSRILLVTDAFDAMTTDRPYRSAMPAAEAIKEIERNRGGQFDPAIVDAFLTALSRERRFTVPGTGKSHMTLVKRGHSRAG